VLGAVTDSSPPSGVRGRCGRRPRLCGPRPRRGGGRGRGGEGGEEPAPRLRASYRDGQPPRSPRGLRRRLRLLRLVFVPLCAGPGLPRRPRSDGGRRAGGGRRRPVGGGPRGQPRRPPLCRLDRRREQRRACALPSRGEHRPSLSRRGRRRGHVDGGGPGRRRRRRRRQRPFPHLRLVAGLLVGADDCSSIRRRTCRGTAAGKEGRRGTALGLPLGWGWGRGGGGTPQEPVVRGTAPRASSRPRRHAAVLGSSAVVEGDQ
jgi:hypothetical protein